MDFYVALILELHFLILSQKWQSELSLEVQFLQSILTWIIE